MPTTKVSKSKSISILSYFNWLELIGPIRLIGLIESINPNCIFLKDDKSHLTIRIEWSNFNVNLSTDFAGIDFAGIDFAGIDSEMFI